MNINKLKGLLAEKSYSRQCFAEKLGITRQGLKSIMDKKRTSTDMLIKMCEVLNVTPNDLLL